MWLGLLQSLKSNVDGVKADRDRGVLLCKYLDILVSTQTTSLIYSVYYHTSWKKDIQKEKKEKEKREKGLERNEIKQEDYKRKKRNSNMHVKRRKIKNEKDRERKNIII